MSESRSDYRVWLGSWICGEGESLQDAADDLVDRVAHLARSMRASGIRSTSDTGAADCRALQFLWHLGVGVTGHEGRRELVLGLSGLSDPG